MEKTNYSEYQVQLANACVRYLKSKYPTLKPNDLTKKTIIQPAQMEVFKRYFPSITLRLKSNPSLLVHDTIWALCQRLKDENLDYAERAYIPCKFNIATLIYLEYLEQHGEDDLIQRYRDQCIEYSKEQSVQSFGFDIFKASEPDHEADEESNELNRKVAKKRACPPREDVDQRPTAMMPYGDHLEEIDD